MEEEPPSPAAPLLVISTLSRLRFGSPAAAAPYQALYQRAAGMLMEVCDARAGVYALKDAAVLSPQVGLRSAPNPRPRPLPGGLD